jgi:hypothetical protein
VLADVEVAQQVSSIWSAERLPTSRVRSRSRVSFAVTLPVRDNLESYKFSRLDRPMSASLR